MGDDCNRRLCLVALIPFHVGAQRPAWGQLFRRILKVSLETLPLSSSTVRVIHVYRQLLIPLKTWVLKKPRAQFQSRGLGVAQDVASPLIDIVSFQSLHICQNSTCGSGREVFECQGKVEGTDELFTSRAQTLCTFPNTRSSAFQNLPLTLLATRIGTMESDALRKILSPTQQTRAMPDFRCPTATSYKMETTSQRTRANNRAGEINTKAHSLHISTRSYTRGGRDQGRAGVKTVAS